MGDLKLFRVDDGSAVELQGRAFTVEVSLQRLIERNLETFFGVRFLASEFPGGNRHPIRIDTIGIDESGSPVIFEYKRATNENVINQGLSYMKWLREHRADFELVVNDRLGREVRDEIDWRSPRLVCIAGDFTRWDADAVDSIECSIDLIRYRRFDTGLLAFELVASRTLETSVPDGNGASPARRYRTVAQTLAASPPSLVDLFRQVEAHLLALGDDVSRKTTSTTFAFRRIRNFADVKIQPRNHEVLVYLRVDPDTAVLEDGFTRSVKGVGHHGSGDLEVRIHSAADLHRAQPLILASYEAS